MADFLRIVIWHIKRFPQPKGLLELVSYPLLDSADMVKLRHVEWSLNGHFYYYRIVSINLTVDHHFSARALSPSMLLSGCRGAAGYTIQ